MLSVPLVQQYIDVLDYSLGSETRSAYRDSEKSLLKCLKFSVDTHTLEVTHTQNERRDSAMEI
jgi:hypothetical protein